MTNVARKSTPLPSEMVEQFDKTKGKLFYQKGAGFLGSILAQVPIIWTTDIPTACISMDNLYWNPEFFESLDPETRVTVLAHELWHNVMAHTLRLNGRCPDNWNKAADYVINLMLKDHGYFMGGFPYLLDERFRDMSTDEVYDIIHKENPHPESDPDYFLAGDIEGTEDDGKILEGMGKILTAYAAAKVSGKPGDVPGEIEQIIENFLNPKLPWNVILQQYFNAMVEDTYSYARINRRYRDPIMPGFVGREGLENLMFGADISGSISDDDILAYFSEGKYIHSELQPELMTFVTFDTEIHDVFEIHRDDDYRKFHITGRGGTDLVELYKKATKEAATALVIFTDLWVDIPPNPGVPVIWVVFNNPSAEVPYGTLIHYNHKKDYV